MNVYRLEHPEDERGPYRCRIQDEKIDKLSNSLYSHAGNPNYPTWREDGIFSRIPDEIVNDDLRYELISGCSSIISLQQWFLGFYEQAIDAGFVLTEYYDPFLIILSNSKKQLAFLPSFNEETNEKNKRIIDYHEEMV